MWSVSISIIFFSNEIQPHQSYLFRSVQVHEMSLDLRNHVGSVTGGNMTAFSSPLFQFSAFNFQGARPFYSTLSLLFFHASKQSAILPALWLNGHHKLPQLSHILGLGSCNNSVFFKSLFWFVLVTVNHSYRCKCKCGIAFHPNCTHNREVFFFVATVQSSGS